MGSILPPRFGKGESERTEAESLTERGAPPSGLHISVGPFRPICHNVYTVAARFEWDETKAARNLTKHGIRFQTAALVFEDPHHADFAESVVIDGEERWLTFGSLDGNVILAVAYTITYDGDDEVIRIISARKADAKERRKYAN